MSEGIGDRTNRFATHFLQPDVKDIRNDFAKFKVAITGNRELLQTRHGQATFLTLANLIARFLPHFVFDSPEGLRASVWVPFATGPLLNQCVIETAGKLGSRAELENARGADVLISVGSTDGEAAYKISIDSEGWNAYFTNQGSFRKPGVGRKENPIGSLLAACFGAADAFRRLLECIGSKDRQILRQPKPFAFSALDYSVNSESAPNPVLPNYINLGELSVIGAGAVGNGLIYTLGMMSGIKGRINVIDPDSYDATSMNRCLAVCNEHVDVPKATALASLNFDNNLRIVPFTTTYELFRKQEGTPEVAVATVDNNNARIQIQSDLPRILFHGATGDNVGTIFRCNFLDDACLGCLFFEDQEPLSLTISRSTGLSLGEVEDILRKRTSLTTSHIERIQARTYLGSRLSDLVGHSLEELYAREICGVMHINAGQKEIAGTVSFVSAIPGILLAGEILKTSIPELRRFSLNNYLTMSVFNPSALWLLRKEKDRRCKCYCSSPVMVDSFQNKWGGIV